MSTSIEQAQFQPTVFTAARRYWRMVFVIAFVTAVAAVGYTLVVPELYRGYATITVPPTSLSKGEGSDQFLDSQVLLIQSPDVADRAARIANAELNANVLSPGDFAGEHKSLEITPPEGSTPGSYGASIVALSFTWPDAKIAQVGTNAVLQAFDDVRVAAITAEGEATVAAIESAMQDARTRGQLSDLVNQRTETLVNLQVDLARHPTVMGAAEPQVPINNNSKRAGAIGMVLGTILGAGLAYARACRRRCLEDRLAPAAIYHAPLIGEIPALWADRNRSNWTAATGRLPMAVDPESSMAEAFRFAAGSVERIRTARGTQLVIAVVSANTGPARSSVVANLALAVAESGTSVLAVDADTAEGGLTARLLAGSPPGLGFAQVLAGQRSISDCVQPSPLNRRLTVLGSGPALTPRITGTAYSRAMEEMVGQARASFDLVLIDSPALLRVAEATELVDKSDAALIVVGSDETVRDHLIMVEKLTQIQSEVLGYIYRGAGSGPPRARHHRDGSSARVARAEWEIAPSW